MNWLPTALIVIAGLGVVYVAGVLVSRIVRISRKAEGLIDQIKLAQVREENTPRSLAGMENVLLPSILKDFPEYNSALIADRVRADARLYYESAAAGKVLFEEGISAALRESMTFPEDVAGGIIVHRVSLSDYDGRSRDRMITYQAACQYDDESGTHHQTRLKLKYLAAYNDDFAQEIRVIKCPNCGAPVPTVGDKVCRYCGAALKTSVGLCWVLTEVKEG